MSSLQTGAQVHVCVFLCSYFSLFDFTFIICLFKSFFLLLLFCFPFLKQFLFIAVMNDLWCLGSQTKGQA